MIFGLPDIKTPLIWALGIALAAALVALGAKHVQLADVRAQLSKAEASRANEDKARTEAAAADQKQTSGAQDEHAIDQQGIAHELTETKHALALARAGHADADRRLRDTAGKLATARLVFETGGNAAAPGSCEHQHRATFGLLEEGYRIAVEAGSLAREGGSLVAERDAEVKALVAQVQADRLLMLRAAGREGLRVPVDLLKPSD